MPNLTCLHKYSNALGAPGKGIHSLRVGPGKGVAFADVEATLVLACGSAAAVVAGLSEGYSLAIRVVLYFAAVVPSFILCLLIGQVLHILFGVDTAVTVFFFGERSEAQAGPAEVQNDGEHPSASAVPTSSGAVGARRPSERDASTNDIVSED